MRTAEQWNELVEASIKRARTELAKDMALGVVPATVASFSDLYDYVDANEYGGLTEAGWLEYEPDCDGEWSAACEQAVSTVQSAIGEWLSENPQHADCKRCAAIAAALAGGAR